MRTDALHLTQPCSVAGATADFSELPYFDGDRDVNPDNPYLSETITRKPFENSTLTLSSGVHLHWALPDALNKSIKKTNGQKFPKVPNRWLIQRIMGSGHEDSRSSKTWIVESDYLWPDNTRLPENAILVPVTPNDLEDGEVVRPYRYMGRQISLESWLNDAADSEYWRDINPRGLTGMGWGNPAFDAFYPNSRSVFGFYDTEITTAISEPIHYTILGWYSHEDDDYLAALRRKGIAQTEKDLLDTLKWVLENGDIDGEAPEYPEKLVCFSQIELQPGSHLGQSLDGPVDVAVGATATEALSALIANETSTTANDIAQREDQLEAVLFGDRLRNHRIDLGPRFIGMRHEKGFNAVESGWQWTLRPRLTETAKGTNHGDAAPQTLSKKFLDRLAELNGAQSIYNQSREILRDLQTQLYADWVKYMVCAYPQPGEKEALADVDKVRDLIETRSIPHLQYHLDRTGDANLPRKDESGYFQKYKNIESRKSHARAVKTIFNSLYTDLEGFNEGQATHWVLAPVSAPRYWACREPSIVLSGLKAEAVTKVRRSERHGGDGHQEGAMVCHNRRLDFNTSQNAQDFSVKSVLDMVDVLSQSDDKFPIGFNQVNHKPWHPFTLEWEVEIFSTRSGSALASINGNYASNYVTRNYNLSENNPDFDDHADTIGGIGLIKSSSIITGQSFLSPSSADNFVETLEGFIESQSAETDESGTLSTAKSAHAFIKNHVVLGQSLNGFNKALLQRHNLMRLPAYDPIGFYEDKNFARRVRQLLPLGIGLGPDLLSDFHPIRAGAMKVLRLRIIDTFGNITDIDTSNVKTTQPYAIAQQPSWVRLPPRLAQPSRIDFRFLDAQANGEMVDHAMSTPLCGWIISNNLDGSLAIYDTDGKALGEVNQNGVWEHPILSNVTSTPQNIKNKHLRNVVSWVLENCAQSPAFLSGFLDNLEEAQSNIHPDGKTSLDAITMLIGRPIAIVRASVDLKLKGIPAANQNWQNLRSDISRKTHSGNGNGFTKVKIPMRIGEFKRLDDGLIGYWIEDSGDFNKNALNLNDSIIGHIDVDALKSGILLSETPVQNWGWPSNRPSEVNEFLDGKVDLRKQAMIEKFRQGEKFWKDLVIHKVITEEKRYQNVVHYSEGEILENAVDDPPVHLTMLMDPSGKVHLSSGINPVKTIQIPVEKYSQALKNIEVSFLSTPLLTSRTRFRMPLPNEQGYSWYWDQKSGESTFSEIGVAPRLNRSKFMHQLNKENPELDADKAWQALLTPSVSWLRGDADFDDWAWLVNAERRASSALPGPLEGYEAMIDKIIDQNHEGIDPAIDRAIFEGPLELREGWLKLKTSNVVEI